jgi:hypothetical protein
MTLKRAVALVILMMPVAAQAADPAPAAAAAPAPGPAVLKSDKPVTIDGALDEPCWQSAAPVPVQFNMGKVGEADPALVMTAKYSWDENYLYIAYEVFDKNLVGVGTGQKQGPKGNEREGCEIAIPDQKIDVVEFFVSFGDPNFMWEIHQNAVNQFNDVFVVVPDPSWPVSKTSAHMYGQIFCPQEFIKDDEAFTVVCAVKMKPKADGKPSTPNDAGDEDTGYTGEIRIPWKSLGIPLDWKAAAPATGWNLAGHNVSLLAVCQDGDRELRYHHSAPTFPGGWFHQGARQWPVYPFTAPAK